MLGHDGPPTSFYRQHLLTGEDLPRCPMRTLQLAAETDRAVSTELGRYLTTVFPMYTDGHLLEDGGVSAQPARSLEILGLIRESEAQIDAKYVEITKHSREGSE
jgi:hypothetical protein